MIDTAPLPPGEPIIRFQHVKKAFGPKKIYDDLCMEIYPGETLTVLGGSGVGKSVMIKMLIGLLQVDSGEILYRGHDLTLLDEKQMLAIRKRISMVFQLAALFDSLNVFENIAYPLREHLKLSEKEIRDKVYGLLDLVHLPHDMDKRYPSELSGGMRKLVSLARSLALEPEVILYDEPTTGLDPESTVNINKLIRSVQRERNVASIVITHDMSGAFYFSDRIAFLYGRKIHLIGPVDEIRQSRDPVLYRFLRGLPDHVPID